MSALFITQKQGDSLDLLAAIPAQFADGFFIGWTVAAQLRFAKTDALVAVLDAQWTDPDTTRTLRLQCLDTGQWPIGRNDFDVQLVRPDGYTTSTSTMTIFVVKDVTRG